ncbi:hypothetical protein [Streptomyces sp. NBC_00690]|uniref:hypothetical protein n=1 Tax=Streptomyces sp. NBC_00690 TaxID=2975808 RepID=UPI002E29AF22|nr:hypothetical protein [Streptomyces sp. NBC_00690]
MTGVEHESDAVTPAAPRARSERTLGDRVFFAIATLTLFGSLVAALLRSIRGDGP